MLETVEEIRMITDLITEKVHYIEVFAVLTEPLQVEVLPLKESIVSHVLELEDGDDQVMVESYDSSSKEVEKVIEPKVKKMKVKMVGKKPAPKKGQEASSG